MVKASVPKHETYYQLGIGDCGHIIKMWPLVHTRKGDRVICDDCTKVAYDIPADEGAIWVYVRREDLQPPKPKTPRAPRKVQPRKPRNSLEEILAQEGLF
jgi:hypothetical protein